MLVRIFLIQIIAFVHCSLSAQWTKVSFSTSTAQALVANGSFLFVGGSEGVNRSEDDGDTWIEVNNGLHGDMELSPVYSFYLYGSALYAGGDYDEGLFRSYNNGASWERLFGGATPMDFASNDTYLFISTDILGVFRSADSGATWKTLNDGIYHASVQALIHIKDSSLLAGDAFGIFYRTTNNGSSWSATDTDAVFSIIKDFASDENYVFAATDRNGILRSSDQGETWLPSSTDIPEKKIERLLTHDGILFAIAGRHVYYSRNSAENWVDFSAGLPDTLSLSSITIKDNYLFVGSLLPAGIWKRSLENLSATTPGSSSEFPISVIYNGLNNKVVFEYNLTSPSDVFIEIVDVLGKPIYRSTVILFQGRNEIPINYLRSGAYFMKLTFANIEKIFKFINMTGSN